MLKLWTCPLTELELAAGVGLCGALHVIDYCFNLGLASSQWATQGWDIPLYSPLKTLLAKNKTWKNPWQIIKSLQSLENKES